MKKRILAGMMVTVLVLASAISVSAAPSKTTNDVTVSTESAGSFEQVKTEVKVEIPKQQENQTTEEYNKEVSTVIETAVKAEVEETFEGMTDAAVDANTSIAPEKKAEVKEVFQTVKEIIAKINAAITQSVKATDTITTEEVQAIVTKIDDKIDSKIKDKNMVQQFFDLKPIGNPEAEDDGLYEVVLNVPNMTKGWKNITVVHYSTVRFEWETLTVTKVDYDNKKVTIKSKDFSPVAIYADIVEESAATGTSPTTEGLSSAWMLWTAVALVAVGSGVVVSQKKRR